MAQARMMRRVLDLFLKSSLYVLAAWRCSSASCAVMISYSAWTYASAVFPFECSRARVWSPSS